MAPLMDEEENVPTPKESAVPDPSGWEFWRKRLSRALLVCALTLAAAQLLPALPEDHVLFIEPPAGALLSRAKVTYFSEDDGEALLGTELVPVGPATNLSHSVRLPNAEYRITIVASGRDGANREQSYTLTRKVVLSGSTVRVFLKPSNTGE